MKEKRGRRDFTSISRLHLHCGEDGRVGERERTGERTKGYVSGNVVACCCGIGKGRGGKRKKKRRKRGGKTYP